MKKTIIAAVAVAAFLLGPTTSPALADCKAEISDIRGGLVRAPAGHGVVEVIERLLAKAEQALAVNGGAKPVQRAA
ncbi:MAG: hypothetical protein QF654_03925 [Alphaproteobacteria bacterium]|jgi:hypothetical protein|nr:hypothetical protein [Alphaproteobacteria bacterium]